MMLSAGQINPNTNKLSAFKDCGSKASNDLSNPGWNPYAVAIDPSAIFKPKDDGEDEHEDLVSDSFIERIKNMKLDKEMELVKDNVIQLLGMDDDDNKSVQSETPSVSDGSDSSEDSPVKSVTLYKTEMCDSFMATGYCRYNKKCKFAHGFHELRPVARHPKYKSILCKNFWEHGYCPYGKRCCFLHKTMSEAEFISFNLGNTSNGAATPPDAPMTSIVEPKEA